MLAAAGIIIPEGLQVCGGGNSKGGAVRGVLRGSRQGCSQL